MNYEAWQSQQKALRDEERKKKVEAQKHLQGYRGSISEEDTKLAILREEERKKKIEAERQLREYRATLSEEDKKLLALRDEERRKKQEAEKKLREIEGAANQDSSVSLISPGSVSVTAKSFGNPNSADAIPDLPVYHKDEHKDETNVVFAMNGTDCVEEATIDHNGFFGDAQPEPAPRRTDVAFTFALICASESPTVEGYLISVEKIANRIASENPEMLQGVAFETPSVRSFVRDGKFSKANTVGAVQIMISSYRIPPKRTLCRPCWSQLCEQIPCSSILYFGDGKFRKWEGSSN